MKKGIKLQFIFFIATLLLLSGGLVFNYAQAQEAGYSQSTVDTLNKQIDSQKDKIDQLTQKISDYQTNIANNQKEAVNLKNQVNLLNNQITKTSIEIDLKNEQIKEIQLQIEQTNLQIDATEKQISQDKDQLADILRLIARSENQSYLTIILSNNSFSDFFDQLKYSSDLQEEMQRTLNRIKITDQKLQDQNQQLKQQEQDLSDALNALNQTQDTLQGQKSDKNQLIVETSQSEKKFQQLVSDLKKALDAANNQMAAADKQLRAELAKKGGTEKFNTLSNAVLAWPTTSHRITTYFHDPTYPFINIVGQHSGLDIGVGLGTPVHAADAGYVAKVAYGTKWYGNYIMILHGGNITTLYGHLSSIQVVQDQYVTKGQLIGLSGSTGFSSGPHLHFEVRSNGIPVDPLGYLPAN